MAPTTDTLVREELVALIEALVPTAHPLDLFKRYDKSLDFADATDGWVVKNPAHCFRVFSLRLFVAGSPPITNGDIERWRYTATLEVAYPRVHYKTTTLPMLGLDTVISDDQRLIYQVLRDQPTNAVWLLEGDTFETEDVGEARIVTYGALYEIYRDMRS